MSPHLYLRFRDRFAGDRPAFLANGATVPYGGLDDRVAALQAAVASFGVEPGDRVVVQVDKSAEAVLLYLACLRLGAVHVPLNPAYTETEVRGFVADADPSLVVLASRSLDDRFAAPTTHLYAEGGGELLQRARAVDRLPPPAGGGGDRPALILYTSGTTGRPKGAVLSHANLVANAEALVKVWEFSAADRLLHALPLFHAHGLMVALHCALLAGASTELLPRFDQETVIARLPEATVFMGVPTFYSRLLGHPRFDHATCRRARLFTSGSAPLRPATWHAVEARTGVRIVERYGMSEAGMITSNPYRGARLPGTVGYPLPDTEVRIVDRSGQPLPAGAIGMLEVRGAGVSAGYWRNPEATAAAYHTDGYLVTGDLASRAADGRITLHGRARDLVISGGFNVYPADVEQALGDVPGIAEAAVVGAPDEDLGERVTAFVVLDGTVAVSLATIRSALDGRLARYKHPRVVAVVTALPRNAMGKVQKGALRSWLDGSAPGTDAPLRFLS